LIMAKSLADHEKHPLHEDVNHDGVLHRRIGGFDLRELNVFR
jgi:hypothetical protein